MTLPRRTLIHMTLKQSSKRWITLGIVSMALLLIVIDVTVLYTALPTLTHDLRASAAQKLWIMNAYTLVVTGLLLGMGTLGDRVGHRRMFIAGLSVFGAASLCAAYSPTPDALVAARALLGVGAAMMMPATLAIIRVMFTEPKERTLAIGIWASIAAGGAAFGPVVGGLLLEYFWWGSVFLINVPVVLAALVLTLCLIPAQPGRPDSPWDLAGSLQIMVALTSVALAIKELARADRSWTLIIVALLTSALVARLFVLRQRRSTEPLLDFSLFGNPRFSGGVMACIVASVALVGVELVYTQRLQLVVGLTPLNAGLAILPVSLAAVVAGPLTGLVLGRVGTPTVILVSLGTTAVALAGLLFAVDTYGVLKLATLILLGVSVGATITAASNAVMNNAPPHRAGMAASVEEVSYELGAAVGVTVLGSVLAGSYTAAMTVPAHLQSSPDPTDSIDAALMAAESLPSALGDALLRLAHTAFDQAFAVVMVVTITILLATMAALLYLQARARRTHAQSVRVAESLPAAALASSAASVPPAALASSAESVPTAKAGTPPSV